MEVDPEKGRPVVLYALPVELPADPMGGLVERRLGVLRAVAWFRAHGLDRDYAAGWHAIGHAPGVVLLHRRGLYVVELARPADDPPALGEGDGIDVPVVP